ncbi:MAG: Sec-independent protein translocase subunit TatC, partial [Burkholderiales bacterium]
MSAQQDSFISHLVELRDRLLRTLIVVGLVFVGLFLYPGSGPIYDFLAAP